MTKKACLWLSVFFLTSLSAWAQLPTPQQPQRGIQTFEIRGKLIFSQVNAPDERIEVNLEQRFQRIQTAFTDSLGQFSFRNLGPNAYTITVRYPGYEDVSQQVEIYSNNTSTSVVIQMQPALAVKRTNGGFEGDDPDIVDVKQLTKSYPKKALQEYEKAIEQNRKGDMSRSVQHLEEAIKIAPDFYHAHNNLGVAYLRLQRFRDAEKQYRIATELNPRAEQPLVNLAILFITESDSRRSEGRDVYGKLLDDAMDSLDEAIKIRPASATAHFYLGTAYYKSDFYNEAEQSLKKACELDPKLAVGRLMLVNVYLKQKRWNNLVEQIDIFVKDNPNAKERKAMEELRQKITKELNPPLK
jgi:tetratricopeptide (TPR) repeat protein